MEPSLTVDLDQGGEIGSYDKQLWEQSVEKKLQKHPHFILHSAPRKNVHLKTEYIDVDIIRGSAFAKTKPQVPWIYVTRKAIARVLLFPFYYNWWVHQTSRKLYVMLLILYILQVVTVCVYLSNFDHMEDELSFTEVILPTILMFLLCLIHSQTVLAHINHKPPKHNKTISGVTRKPSPKRSSHKAKSSDNNSTCQEDNGIKKAPRISKRQTRSHNFSGITESLSSNVVSNAASQKNLDPIVPSSIDMEGSLLSRSVSDYDLKPAINPVPKDVSPSQSPVRYHRELIKYDTHPSSDRQYDTGSRSRRQGSQPWGKEEINIYSKHGKWGDGTDNSAQADQKSGCCYNLLDNLPNLLTVEKVFQDVSDEPKDEEIPNKRAVRRDRCSQSRQDSGTSLEHVQFDLPTEEQICSLNHSGRHCLQHMSSCKGKNEDLKMSNNFAENCATCDSSSISKHICKGKIFVPVDISKNVSHDPESAAAKDREILSAGMPSYLTGIISSPDSLKTLRVSQINKDISSKISSCFNNEQFSEWSKTCGRPQEISTDVSDGKQNQKHTVDNVPSEYSSLNEHPCLTDFEMVDQQVIQEKIFSGQRSPSAGLSSQAVRSVPDIAHLSLVESESQSKNTRRESDPLMAEDSSDSIINSTVHCLRCICPKLHMDTKTIGSCVNSHGETLVSYSTIDAEDLEGVSLNSYAPVHSVGSQNSAEISAEPLCCDLCLVSTINHQIHQELSFLNDSTSSHLSTVKTAFLKPELLDNLIKDEDVNDIHCELSVDTDYALQRISQAADKPPRILSENSGITLRKDTVSGQQESIFSESPSQLECFSEYFAQEILNEDTLREMSCSSLLANSELENSCLSVCCEASAQTPSSSSSATCSLSKTRCTSLFTSPSAEPQGSPLVFCHHHHLQCGQNQQRSSTSSSCAFHGKIQIHGGLDDEKNDPLEESLEQIHLSEEDRHSDDLSNYNPSDSDVDSDGSVNEDVRSKYEEKWNEEKLKRLRFQELADESEAADPTSKENKNVISGAVVKKSGMSTTKTKSGITSNVGGSRSVVGILTRKPSPLKDLTIGRKSNNTPVNNSSGSEEEQAEVRNQLRRRRRTSGTSYELAEPGRNRHVHNNLVLQAADGDIIHISSSENEVGGVHILEESNKATMSSEEWEDRMQSDETTSSAYSSNSDVDCEEKVKEEGEEKAESITSTFHVINLLQPQNGSPSNSANVTQPDRVSCMIWEGSEYKKMDLTALDIGWAIIDKVDSLPESSDYFLIGLSFSFIICMVPLVFRAYANRDLTSTEGLLTWSGLLTKLVGISALVVNSYSWRQYLLMVNGIFQRFLLSLIFFFLLSVADRTFKQRLLYAKHFSYLTSSRRARKFSMPHFRLNKVRNIKIWLSLRSYLKRRGPQRSVDVIVSASFLFTVSIVCLISLQMLKETDSYLDYLCNWELLVWCIALAVFLMRFMTLGLQINKKYRNLSVLITEQINLYLQMEQKPHKKEELILANNVLRLAEDLLKELESPFKISGFSANPLIYNIMRIVVLSAFSAVLTEVLGFKLKLHKINFKG